MKSKTLEELSEAQLFNMSINNHYKDVFEKVRKELESRLGLIGDSEWIENINF